MPHYLGGKLGRSSSRSIFPSIHLTPQALPRAAAPASTRRHTAVPPQFFVSPEQRERVTIYSGDLRDRGSPAPVLALCQPFLCMLHYKEAARCDDDGGGGGGGGGGDDDGGGDGGGGTSLEYTVESGGERAGGVSGRGKAAGRLRWE
ncbi:hypothetical protein ALC62_10021 [Cyphomyrmex costatus]|uniref:Uncharacterized protein n=1 Tax=Cyphomyrmex costatus TaxID=456900 RepID=A0A151IEL2_9HYME|nr:hypothetical protein ALC62_10021 [Cyphomyrmex costatus]